MISKCSECSLHMPHTMYVIKLDQWRCWEHLPSEFKVVLPPRKDYHAEYISNYN